MTPQLSHILVTLGIVALVAWRMHARVRRLIGRQKLPPVRPWVTVVLFPVLIALLALAAHTSSRLSGALAAGVAVGVMLGVIGLRLTRYEVASDGLYYTPSAHLGVALSTLLVARLVWRFLFTGMAPAGAGLAAGSAVPGQPPQTALTPLTLLLFGTLAGYYFTYAVGLLRWAYRNRGVRGERTCTE
jgi:hypothetical protein